MTFEDFWKIYPRRVGKGAAEKAFKKLDPADHSSIELAIEAQKRYRAEAKKTGEFLPDWCHPATWLNQQRWLDEIGSHADLKERAESKICSVEGCKTPVLGSRFCHCEHHYQFDSQGRMRGHLGLVPELRKHYAEHPGIHDLRGKPAIEYMKNCIRRMMEE